ncbi:PQQ-dependent sugar dehydrogenase [Kibdelosporangium philippinense]|uniref:PQQ-dependent sugar dehydrogenase n=1 Tax=Kibdelosporangium philippinense TaxID=211113 RepID=A0ABS8ZN46_9PSEU|nr:PQQ-dependent sugar dehydrogenase [Kibdelosporangium philippinense]MCE7008051.1 PQQ-dependent sugar dehydrogenase [Kibdelosporangium philippinense]
MTVRRKLAIAAASATTVLLAASTAIAAPVQPLAIRQVASGLNQAWAVDFLPDGTALFTEKDSRKIKKIAPNGQVSDVQTISGVSVTKEAGLLGIAVSPTYAADQLVFIYYTTSSDNRIAKLKLGQAPNPIVTGIPRGSQYHHGGRIKFGPDGFLYAGTGDGQNGANAQNRDSLGGKVLRVDKNGAAAPGNPFNSRVYSLGHRNVQGLAWVGTQLYISDIGASEVDELNKITAGGNYGWPSCEGPCSNPAYTNPVKTWPTSQATPSGLTYYKGSLFMASLKGGTFKLNTSGAGGKIYTNLGRTRDEVTGPNNVLWVITPSGIYNADGA